jgi:hypothetical protein
MDNNNSTMITLIVINLIINLITVIDHFITKLKRSKCWFGEIEMNDIKDDTVKNFTQDNNKLKELIDILNNKSNNNKSNNDNKNDDNKLKI